MTTSISALVGAEETFNSRSREIERLFEMLQFMSTHRDSQLVSGNIATGTGAVYNMGRELEKTLRASVYLMLYNLVEATMTHAIDAIHVHISGERVGFDDLKEDVRKIAIKGLRKAVTTDSPAELLNTTIPISSALIWLGFDKKDLFSGNLDGRLIRDKAKEYGFQIASHDTSTSRDGANLVRVKTKRNELAHGGISFEDCGHDISMDEIVSTFEETKIYLKAVLDGICEYLMEKKYLHRVEVNDTALALEGTQ